MSPNLLSCVSSMRRKQDTHTLPMGQKGISRRRKEAEGNHGSNSIALGARARALPYLSLHVTGSLSFILYNLNIFEENSCIPTLLCLCVCVFL